MKELALKYGCNPNQKPARIFMTEGELPIEVLNGKPGYINFCDAFNSWQLVRALKKATGLPAAASFKHVSPAGAALGKPLTDIEKQMYFVDTDKELSPIACAYIRARGADRLCSYGDWAALSDTCDADTASYLAHEVSDGIIAPDFTAEALEILKTKRKGGYNVVRSTRTTSSSRSNSAIFSASALSRVTTTTRSTRACSPTSLPRTRICRRAQSTT